jgi:hypothetical protein
MMVALYPVFLGVQVAIDKLTGWRIAEAFGKEPPR